MTGGSVARRYAAALYDLASEEDQAKEIGAGLAEIAEAVAGLEPGTLAAGALATAQREAVAAALGAKVGEGSTLAKFLGVVAAADRFEHIPAMREWYGRMADAAAGRVRLSITSGAPLDSEEIEAIKRTFRAIDGREIVPELEVDERLIGGVTVELEGRTYDGSVKTQLAKLQARMGGQA